MNQKIKILIKSSLVLVMFAYSLSALGSWVSPPSGCVPPNCTTDPSINVGGTLQSKAGILVFNGGQSLSSFEIGPTYGAGLFKVNSAGNITKINNLSYTSWPSAHVAGYLKNNGSGVLTWEAGGGGGSITLTGDVTGTGTGTIATTIANSAVTEAKLDISNSPTDEECLTYESTGTTLAWQSCGSSGEANTASNLGGGLANFDSKNGVDLRFNSFTASDFNLASNLISIDYTNGQTASGSQNGFLSSGNWTTFNNKVSSSRAINTTGLISGGGDLSADRTITTSMNTGKLVGRSSTGTGVMEEITVGSGLSLSGGTLTASGGGSIAFSSITTGTNTAALLVGPGGTFGPTGSGIITATRYTGSGSTTNEVDLATTEVAGKLPISKIGSASDLPTASILVVETAGTLVPKQPSARDSVRVNASQTGWENFTPVDAGTLSQDIAGIKNFTGTLRANNLNGLTQVITVRNSAGTGTCTLTVTKGLITSTSC